MTEGIKFEDKKLQYALLPHTTLMKVADKAEDPYIATRIRATADFIYRYSNALFENTFNAVGITKILEFGSIKYEKYTWRKGMSWMSLCNACLRHLINEHGEARGVNDIDQESGLCHLHHFSCNVEFLHEYAIFNLGIDDRPIFNEVKHNYA